MNVLTPEQREIVARLQSGRLMICDGQGDPNSDGCGGQGYTGAAGQEPCPHCYGAGVMTPELRVALASAPSPEAGAGGDLDAEAKRIMDAAWPEYGGNHQSAEFWQAFDEAVGFTLKLIRSGKLVASTGSGKEETKGASFGPDSCPSGDAPDGSSSQATAIPSRETPAQTEARMYDAGRITGHYSDPDGSPDIGYSVGLGDGKMLWIGEISERLFSETGAAGSDLGGSCGTWFVVYGQRRGSTYVLGKALDGIDANSICCAVSAALVPAKRDHVVSARLIAWEPGSLGGVDLTFESGLRVALPLSEPEATPQSSPSQTPVDPQELSFGPGCYDFASSVASKVAALPWAWAETGDAQDDRYSDVQMIVDAELRSLAPSVAPSTTEADR